MGARLIAPYNFLNFWLNFELTERIDMEQHIVAIYIL